MDSGNSGSIQSSSGGDEEYDSRAADDSSFNNPSSTTNPLLFSHSSTMFDPLSNYFNPPSLTQPQSDQTNQTLMNTNMPTWSSKPQPNPFFTPMAYTQHSQTIGGGTTTTTSAAAATATGTGTTTASGNNNQDQSSQSAVASGARNPKKRSRASRRAPTTVLTTDTSNFRAMVQEFTGIPSPPFTSSSSPFPRTRLDLFTSPTTLSTSSFRSPPTSTFHHNLLRPFPHKIQPQLSTFTNSNHNINTISTAAAATSTTSPSAILKQPPQRSCNDNYILNNMQIQNLAFESFLPQPSSNDDQDFGVPSHTQVNTNLLQNISNKNNNGSDLNYAAASASSNLNFLGEKELVADDHHHHHHNVSAASASTTRGEGLMESWICSSD